MCCGDDPDMPHEMHWECHDMAPLFGDPAFCEVAPAHDHRLGKGSIAPAGERGGDIPCKFDGTCPSSHCDPVVHQ